MSRLYIVGLYYHIKEMIKSFKKHGIRITLKRFRALYKNKYYWTSTEEKLRKFEESLEKIDRNK
jgi:pyruvate-formate lyase-activating enzyme